MPLFFNNRFNNMQNRYNNGNNNFMFNNFQNNNRFGLNSPYIQNSGQNNQQNNIPPDINLKPLTQEELEKINEEIKENIEKNRKTVFNIEKPKSNDTVCKYIQDFIQDETNANIFYNELSKKCAHNLYREKLENICNECNLQCNDLKSYYMEINNEKFEPKDIPINVNVPLRLGLFLAMEEEIKGYDKLCKIIDELPPQDIRMFYKMALKKLSRINSIQYMAINEVN